MKVLFHAYNTCCQTESGGVQVRVRKIKNLLEDRGIQVDFFSAFETNLRDYDVLHVFSLQDETYGLISCAKKLGLKIVLSSIVNTDYYRARSIDNTLRINRFLNHFGIFSVETRRSELINNCDVVIAETQKEATFIHKHYHYPLHKTVVLPNGVDVQPVADDEIFSFIGNRRPYVLQVGRIDTNKNLLTTIRAVKGADYDLVVVGGPYAVGSSNYYEKCKDEASPNVHFLGWLPAGSNVLFSAYQNAQALVVPSLSETFGLVCLEGAMAGAHVCLSKTLPILEFDIFDNNLTFDPHNFSEIRQILDKAMAIPKDNKTKQKALEVFSWENIVQQHVDIYRK